MRSLTNEIRRFATAKKRPIAVARPSRASKKSRSNTPLVVDFEDCTKASSIVASEAHSEAVVALSALMALPPVGVLSSIRQPNDHDAVAVVNPEPANEGPIVSRSPPTLGPELVNIGPTVSQVPPMPEWMAAPVDQPSTQEHGKVP